MTDCATHETDLGRRAARRPDAPAPAALEGHLAGCEACRGYARGLEHMGFLDRACTARTRTWPRA